MLKKILLCLVVTSLYCNSFCGNEVNAMESVSQDSKSKEKNVIKDECILCRADPKELFALKSSFDYSHSEEDEDDSRYYCEAFYDIDDMLDFFYTYFMAKYEHMWYNLLRLTRFGKYPICSKKHYKICEYDFFDKHNLDFWITKIWDKWISEHDDFYIYPVDYCRCHENSNDKYYVRGNDISFQSFWKRYFEYNCENKCKYLLQPDIFHRIIMNEFCNAKLLDEKHIKYFFGSKNFYEALIVSLIRFKLSTFSIEELLFDIRNGNIANFDFDLKNGPSYTEYERGYKEFYMMINDFIAFVKCSDFYSDEICLPLMLEKFKSSNGDFFKNIQKSNDIPLIISQLNNVSYISSEKDEYDTGDNIYKTKFDSKKLDNTDLTSNLEKVLNRFSFCKLKFNFELDSIGLRIKNPKEETIADFLSFVFESKYHDITTGEISDGFSTTEIYDRWCAEILKTLCDSADNLESCKLFEYIDEAIRNKNNFLQHLLEVLRDYYNYFEMYCSNKERNYDDPIKKNAYNRDDLRKLVDAMLKYYKDKLPKDKLDIIEQFDIDKKIINNDE